MAEAQDGAQRQEARSRLRSSGRWLLPRAVPALLVLFGIGVAALIAYRSRQAIPPTATEAAFLVLASSALNIAGAVLFARIGRADPRHARSAVRRLLSTGRSIALASEHLVDALDTNDSGNLRESATRVQGELLVTQQHLYDAIQDWNDVHREALREVIEAEERSAPERGGKR